MIVGPSLVEVLSVFKVVLVVLEVVFRVIVRYAPMPTISTIAITTVLASPRETALFVFVNVCKTILQRSFGII